MVTQPVNCRFMSWNIGPRSSSETSMTKSVVRKLGWVARRSRAVKLLLKMAGGPPSVIAFQEMTKDQQVYMVRALRKAGYDYGHYGNGMGGHPEDRSGDNVVIFWLLSDWERITSRQGWAYTPDRDYFVAVCLQRKGTNKKRWFASSHPTVGKSLEKRREAQVTGQAKIMRLNNVDLERTAWAMDSNSTAKSTVPGVRKALRSFGLRSVEEMLSSVPVGDTAHHFGREKYVAKTGYVPIDLIAANPNQIRFRNVKIITDDVLASDHYPLVAGLELI